VGPVNLGFPTCHFTNGTNFVDTLQSLYRLPTPTNYAVGGALSDNSNTIPGLPGFAGELVTLAASGTRFTPHDLIALSIGTNDSTLIASTDTIAETNALATTSAANAAAGVQQLVARGARNIAWMGTGNSAYFPSPSNGADGLPLSAEQRTTWASTYFQEIQQRLAPLARSGVRIFLFDQPTLQARIAADPGRYGFASAGGCQATLGVPGCLAASSELQNSFFYFNNHPTSAAMTLIGRYLANQIDAPLTVVPQGAVTTGIAVNFATSVFGRLDAYRTFQSFGIGLVMEMDRSLQTKAAGPKAPEDRWSIYGEASYAGGSVGRQFLSAGYDYQGAGGTAGIEYRVNPNLRLGAVLGYAEPDVDLDVQNAHARIRSHQLAGYGSFTDANWFADAVLAYGRHDLDLDRQGVLDVIRARTNADTFTAAVRVGHLVDIGPFRAGPVGGLHYTSAGVRAYAETGDSLLTMLVDRQAADSLTGEAGLQVRFPFLLAGGVYSPFVNLTAGHDFIGSDRDVTTTQFTTPLLPVLTPVPDGGVTFGKVAAGIAATIAGNVAATINAATTFARDGGNDVAVSSGIKVSF
jgi:uncharacterized protein YhjY with autotransporter beta-barrel domain